MLMVSTSHNQTIRLWDVAAGVIRHILDGHSDYVTAAAFSPDGKPMASPSNDRRVMLCEVDQGPPLRRFEGHIGYIRAVAFSPDGQMLTSARSMTRQYLSGT
jgi:WD40 repeat protein